MRANPHLLEINARSWLCRLRERYSPDITLSTIPMEELEEIRHLGFDGVWLMGVWTTSAKAEQLARSSELVKKAVSELDPQYKPEDISASPFAINEFKLNPLLGKPEELKQFKEKLNSMGLRLFLDFVSNHLAIDHPLTQSNPDYFVQAAPEDIQYHNDWFFECQSQQGPTYLAYGRDPNFPPWKDTAQLNYYNPAARKYMLDSLLGIAEQCDGVRCDMVMLTLNEVVEGTWGWLLKKKGFQQPRFEFWEEAIETVREKHPRFCFLAEVYWGLEWRLQEMGFDYTYDKVLYDRLRQLGAQDVKGHLRAEKLYQKRSVRFIENHDEPSAITAFGEAKSKAAAVVCATLGGLRLFYLSQMRGIPHKIPLQYVNCKFKQNPAIYRFYEKLLKITDHPAYHGGEWNLIEPMPSAQGNESFKNMLCWYWNQRRTLKLVTVNYSNTQANCRVKINVSPKEDCFTFYDELAEQFFTREAKDIKDNGLYIELPPYGAHLLDLEF
ncbi:MAG TPA: alpha-amylase family glycosyl hydrolase [Elusimicrobiales bacterium]|nr:alpha-amylase family glycosyl hydrolase [Elusimicrobiales bacterium]